MGIVRIVLSALFFLSVSLWLGALVLLAIASRLIDSALKGRRTEGRQIIRRLRGIFQSMELIALAAAWGSSVAQLLLERFLGQRYPGTWGTAQGIMIALLVVPTVAAMYSTFYLTGATKRREAQLGSYADKDEQIRVRKSIALLHKQAEMLTWLKAVLVTGVVIAAVIALHPPGGPAGRPGAGTPTTQTQPARAN
ncbi:MAG: hypothetical protein AMJ81_03680 [Phycisphaerae bacterium SM23_33]|jgi:hypothetical protein|nr:MAG: hypothetical protein AMJ81_03680 [Phycisphaerae bacterium SM23_33]